MTNNPRAVIDVSGRLNHSRGNLRPPPGSFLGSPAELADRAQRLADELTSLRRDLLSLVAGTANETHIEISTPALLSAVAAAGYLMVSRTTIFALIKSGELTSVLIGSARRIPRSACDAYVAGLLTAQESA